MYLDSVNPSTPNELARYANANERDERTDCQRESDPQALLREQALLRRELGSQTGLSLNPRASTAP
jgi:hypothetical protein